MLNGSISTAGNVMFVGNSQDNSSFAIKSCAINSCVIKSCAIHSRVIKVKNADELWKARFPAAGQATPMNYSTNVKYTVFTY